MDVKGCAAIVTGGGSGMGAETGRFLAAAGAKVALLDVNLDGAKQVAGEIGGRLYQLRRHCTRQAHRRPRRADATGGFHPRDRCKSRRYLQYHAPRG